MKRAIATPSSDETDRRQFVFGGALAAASATAFALAPRRAALRVSADDFENSIPSVVGDYHARPPSAESTPLPDEISQQLYDHVLTRVYVAPYWPPIMLLVAYGSAEDGTRAIHRPDSCYAAAGYSVTEPLSVPLAGMQDKSGRAMTLTASLDAHVEQIYFWTRVGTSYPINAREEHIDLMKSNIRGVSPDGVLVRLSVVARDRALALRQLMTFNATLMMNLPRRGQALLLGVIA